MSPVSVTVVVPTLAADPALTDCLRSLESQSMRDFEIIVVDNSGMGKARRLLPAGTRTRVIENAKNVGFGSAVNQAIAASASPFIAVLNDDAVAAQDWLSALLRGVGNAGMCASQVRLYDTGRLDSAGMLISGDASSKQRGHGEDAATYGTNGPALLPSGSAALYRRKMIEDIGPFDDHFFLYCEDTDLGLRARWAGWNCAYVADAIVEHRYSHSAGRASAIKAYYVERNRLFVAVKNFPLGMLILAPFVAFLRYSWHIRHMLQGRGKAAEFAASGSGLSLVLFVLKAHAAVLLALPRLLAQRRSIRQRAKITPREFRSLLRQHWISPEQVAAH